MNAAFERQNLNEFLEGLGITPESITKMESPDFVVAVDGIKIGIEHVLAAPEELRRLLHLQKTAFPNQWIKLNGLKTRPNRRSNQELVRHVRSPLNPTFDEISTVDEIAECVARLTAVIQAKIEKLNRPHFVGFDQNWLLVIDEPPILLLDEHSLGLALSQLQDKFSKLPSPPKQFDRIYIRNGRYWLSWKH